MNDYEDNYDDSYEEDEDEIEEVKPRGDSAVVIVNDLIEPLVIDSTETAIESNVRRSDLINCANSFKLLHAAISSGAVRGVKSLCTVLEAVRKEAIHRRHILEIPYGAKDTSNRRDPFEPLP